MTTDLRDSDHLDLGSIDRLRTELSRLENVVVAFSGGVDSALLAWVANDTLGADNVVLATAVSASLAPAELESCRVFAGKWGFNWLQVGTDETSRPEYVANGSDRCYHCKSALMDRLEPLAKSNGAVVVLGVNVDDLSEHRPGQVAARERGAVFPMVTAGMTKQAVRAADVSSASTFGTSLPPHAWRHASPTEPLSRWASSDGWHKQRRHSQRSASESSGSATTATRPGSRFRWMRSSVS